MTENKHNLKIVTTTGLIDHAECSCGWESLPYYDGVDFVTRDWNEHVKKVSKHD